jgi:hypothetical protein
MRRPLLRIVVCSGLVLLGSAVAWVALSRPDHTALSGVIGALGLFFAVSALMPGIVAVFHIGNYRRLRAGQGGIARWRVSAAEWDRFRAFDRARNAKAPELDNDFSPRKVTPPDGVEIVVGPDQVMIDGSYHLLQGTIRDGVRVAWLDGDPACLEFPMISLPGRTRAPRPYSLRFPVPAAARAEALRVIEHFNADPPLPVAANS